MSKDYFAEEKHIFSGLLAFWQNKLVSQPPQITLPLLQHKILSRKQYT